MYTTKRLRKVSHLKEKEEINQKLKLSFTSDKLASDYGFNPHSVYRLTKDKERLANYRKDNPYSPIRKTFIFSAFPNVDKALKISLFPWN